MSDIEAKTAGAFGKLLDARCLNVLSPEEEAFIAVFLALQRHRVRNFREALKDMDVAMAEKIRRLGGDPTNVKGYAPFVDDEDLKVQSSAMLPRLIGAIAPLLLEKKWVLFQPPSGEQFWISDNPVSLHNNQDFGVYGNLGSAVPGIEVYLPVAPTLTLGVWCPTRADAVQRDLESAQATLMRMHKWSVPATIGKQIETEQLRLRYERASAELSALWNSVTMRTPVQCTSQNMKFFNSLQVVWAEKYVMSSTNDWAFARQMIAEKSHSRRGPRMRLD